MADDRTEDEEEWATIRALLKAGCSLPDRLQKKYDAHSRKVKETLAESMRGSGLQEGSMATASISPFTA